MKNFGGCFFYYKSKTELRLALIKSFKRIQKANIKYTANHNPTVTKDK